MGRAEAVGIVSVEYLVGLTNGVNSNAVLRPSHSLRVTHPPVTTATVPGRRGPHRSAAGGRVQLRRRR